MNSFSLDISQDQWLTKIIKINSFSLKVEPVAAMNDNVHRIDDVLNQSPVFAYAKCPVSGLKATSMLEKKRFSLIDTNVVLQKKINRRKKAISTEICRPAIPNDEQEVTALARNNFSFSRFHLDCAFNKETADAIKAAWAKSFFLGLRGEFMVVAQSGGKIAGFLQLLVDKESKTLIIDLIAVDKPMQGKGIARTMIAYAENHFKSLDYIKVGTQIANLPSLKLYESLGFCIDSANYVLHYHNRQ